MRTDLCRRCFQAYVDPLASNRQLLVGRYVRKCAGCQKLTNLVVCYFKYGEHITSEDSKHIVSTEHVHMKPEVEETVDEGSNTALRDSV